MDVAGIRSDDGLLRIGTTLVRLSDSRHTCRLAIRCVVHTSIRKYQPALITNPPQWLFCPVISDFFRQLAMPGHRTNGDAGHAALAHTARLMPTAHSARNGVYVSREFELDRGENYVNGWHGDHDT